jgi:chemotaxis protein CheZ
MVTDVANGDCAELEALFDSVVQERQVLALKKPSGKRAKSSRKRAILKSEATAEELLARVGHLTRQLYESLQEMGCEQSLQRAASEIPETHDRLAYVAQMTKSAAERVLNATEAAEPLQNQIATASKVLEQRWDALTEGKLSINQFKELVGETRSFLATSHAQASDTLKHLHEIMMAQDFQDLTGQVIKRVIDLVQDMEKNLVRLLLDAAPADIRAVHEPSLKNGPVISVTGAADVARNQKQVDDLLESLGF